MRETAPGISTLQKKRELFWILLMVLCGRLFGQVRIRPAKASEFFSLNFLASKCEQNSFIGGSKGGSKWTSRRVQILTFPCSFRQQKWQKKYAFQCVPPACWPYLPACTVQGGICSLRGGVCSWGVCSQGVLLLRGVSAPGGGVSAPGVSAPGGSVCSWGVCYPSMH